MAVRRAVGAAVCEIRPAPLLAHSLARPCNCGGAGCLCGRLGYGGRGGSISWWQFGRVGLVSSRKERA